ncbi:NADPH:quinone oxidoreductase family protein [Sphingosinicellaceae bacterium]|nr:NADPH:quinone oxidoreductase family protein [Sphingosinicellaceae bacterium]
MRALVCHRLSDDRSGTRVETDWPEAAVPGPDEITVAMTAAALNYPDLLMLSGGYQMKPELPFVPGSEGAGHIVSVGEGVSGELIGERVVVGARLGTLAERMTLPLAAVRSLPPGMHDEQAAAFTIGGLTAWVGLVERGRLAAGERVLVLGAGGGMGWAAVQVAKARGAYVLAATSDPAKAELLRGSGADEVLLIDRAAPDFGFKDIDVVFDPVGGALVMPALKTLCWNGRYLVIGFTGGAPVRVPLNRMLIKGIEVVGVRAGEAGRQDPAAGVRHLREIDALAAAGKVTPHIGMAVPLERADEAFAAMAAGRVTGKAVVVF